MSKIPAADLRSLLPDISARTAAQMMELHRHPTPARAEHLAIELEGVRRLALDLRAALISEGGGDAGR